MCLLKDIYPHYLQILDSDMKGEDEELRGENEGILIVLFLEDHEVTYLALA